MYKYLYLIKYDKLEFMRENFLRVIIDELLKCHKIFHFLKSSDKIKIFTLMDL